MNNADDNNDGITQPFLAQITDVYYETTGQYTGMWMYSWVAQSPFTNIANYAVKNSNPARSGIYTTPYSYGAAVENNNLPAPIGSFVWLTYKCFNGADLYAFDLDSGNYLIKCTSATATAGWYPGNLQVWNPTTQAFYQPQQWDKGTPGYITSTVWFRDANGGVPVVGTMYPCQYVGLYSSVQSFVTSSVAGGFWARITTASGGPWKFVALTLNSGGGFVDDGVETATYCATASTIDGTNYCNPVTGLRVWMIPSKQPGKFEFLPIGYANGSLPGLVSGTTQTFSGSKTFQDDIKFHAKTIANCDGATAAQTGLYVLGNNTSHSNPVNVALAGFDGTLGKPYFAIGQVTASASAYDGGIDLVPVFDSLHATVHATGVPLSVSGYVVTPYIQMPSCDNTGGNYARLMSGNDPFALDGLAVFTVGGGEGFVGADHACDYLSLSAQWVRVPSGCRYKVSNGLNSDYQGYYGTIHDASGNVLKVQGGIICDYFPAAGGGGSPPPPPSSPPYISTITVDGGSA